MENKKRALVMSGGGSNGSYQVGAIKYLTENLGRQYTIFAGVSVGAINCAHMAMYHPRFAKKASSDLYDLWANLNTKDIYKRWFPFGRLHALWKQSLYNTQPLRDLINNRLNQEQIKSTKNRLLVGATSITTGKYMIFDENYPNLAGAILASSAFPLMFCPIELDGELYLDGGVRTVVPVKAAIEAGATAIDVIIAEPDQNDSWVLNKPKTLDIGARTLGLMVDEITDNDLVFNKSGLEVNIIRPSSSVGNSFDFSSALNIKRANRGFQDAQAILTRS